MRISVLAFLLVSSSLSFTARAADDPSAEFSTWWKRAIGTPGSPPNIDGVMFRLIYLNGLDPSNGSTSETDGMQGEDSASRPGQFWVWKLGPRWRVSANLTATAMQDVAWNDSVAWGASPTLLTIVPQNGIENSPFRYDALGGSRLGQVYDLLTLGLYQQVANGFDLHPRMTSETTWELHHEGAYLEWSSIVVDAKGTWNAEERLGRISSVTIAGKNQTESGEETRTASDWTLIPSLQLYIAKQMSFQMTGSPSLQPHRVALLETKEFSRADMERLVATPRQGDVDPLRGERRFQQIDDMASRRWVVTKFDDKGVEIPNAFPVIASEDGGSLRQTVAYVVAGSLLLGLGAVAIGRLRARHS